MQIDPQKFLEDGYVILKSIIPPDRLDELRASFETLVDRQQAIWARDRDDPGNHAYKAKQPRLAFQTGVDAATANTVELCLHEHTLGVSQQALRDRHAALSMMFLMCNPETHYGPDLWHRDHRHGPDSHAPLAGLQTDMLANGPGSVQWNIPLYDDDVLWIVPGSHRRLNTARENGELLKDPRAPLSSGMQVKLEAGDGVMYINTNLHWPSNYSTKLRRVIHLGYRSFGGQLYPLRIALLLGAELRQTPIGGGAGHLPAVHGIGRTRARSDRGVLPRDAREGCGRFPRGPGCAASGCDGADGRRGLAVEAGHYDPHAEAPGGRRPAGT